MYFNDVIAACGIVLAIIIARRRRRRKNRSVWVREWIKNRPQLGAYHQLVQELEVSDTRIQEFFTNGSNHISTTFE